MKVKATKSYKRINWLARRDFIRRTYARMADLHYEAVVAWHNSEFATTLNQDQKWQSRAMEAERKIAKLLSMIDGKF